MALVVMVLTVGSGPDGDHPWLSTPHTGESPHVEFILMVLLQTVYSHRLPLRVFQEHLCM